MVRIPRLYLKLFRDIRAARMQFGAVILIIFLGVAIFIGAYGAYLNLQISYNTTFERLAMADYWITVDALGESAVRKINAIPGVQAIGRITGEVSIDLANEQGEKVSARVVSLPLRSYPSINTIRIVKGNYFSAASYREILLEKRFAEYHKFQPGDSLTIQRDNLRTNFTIAGIVTSPEFIWVVKNEREAMPSPRIFGIIFMAQPMAENIFDMKGMNNELLLRIADNGDHGTAIAEVKQVLHTNAISRVTSKNDLTAIKTRKLDIIKGVRSAYLVAREDQATNRMLRQDLEGLASIAFLFPVMFLSMASLTIYVLMNRMIESQRIQIGIMRAMGYTRLQVLFHYLGYGLFVGIIGSVIGGVLGHLMSDGWTSVYVDQLNIPFTVTAVHWDIILIGVLIGVSVPLIAGLIPAWATLRIRPVEAMRPPVPATGNRGLLRISELLLHWLPHTLKLPLRNIFRNVKRSLFMVMGIVSAIVLILVVMSFVDAMDELIRVQWDTIEDYDARIIFQGTGTASTANYIKHFDGISEAEAILEVPYRIRFGKNIVDSSVMGIPAGSSMYHLVAANDEPIDVVKDGILLPESFQKKLGARVGDILQLEPMVGTVGATEKKLAGIARIPIGARTFMPLDEVQALIREPGTASSILVRFNGEPSDTLMKRLYNLPNVSSVELARDTRALIDEQMGFFWIFVTVMFIMGATLGAAIIFNGVTVNVLQRTREIAIMRAIGKSRAGIAAMLTLENFAIGCIGILLGIPAGRYLAQQFMDSMMTSTEDLFSYTMMLLPRSYIIAIAFALVVLFLSQLPAIRQVYRLSLATATKEWCE